MRVSIPALFMTMIMIQQVLLGRTKKAAEPDGRFRYTLTDKETKFVRCVLIVFLIIGSVVPLQEMTRSVVYTLPAYPVTKGAMVSLGNALQDSQNQSISSAGTAILMQSQYPITVVDTVKTLANDGSSLGNFRGPIANNLFYEYLARQ